jgi:hypothetical protein
MSKTKGAYYNMAGFHYVPTHETVRETAARLAEGERLRWPGSISIHGHMQPMPTNMKRGQPQEDRVHKRRLTVVYDVEWGRYVREWV